MSFFSEIDLFVAVVVVVAVVAVDVVVVVVEFREKMNLGSREGTQVGANAENEEKKINIKFS